jgi:GDP/UDP-N,N'-diacetylbacillosamine 2-epimerase (hydrolysing)
MESRALFRMIDEFVNEAPDKRKAFASLGQLKYLSCMKFVDGLVGNSSSALLEAPTLKKGAVNIGSRQNGRLKASSVIDCDPKSEDIFRAINRLYTEEFQDAIKEVRNPYGNGGAAKKIIDVLVRTPFQNLIVKEFHDIPTNAS